MDSNLIVQYSLVGLCLLGAIAWIIYKASKKGRRGGCCGCSMSDACVSAKHHRKDRKDKQKMQEADSAARECCPHCKDHDPSATC